MIAAQPVVKDGAPLVPRKVAVVSAVILALQTLQVLIIGPTTLGSFLTNSLQTLTSILAVGACVAAARRARYVSRPFWLLFGAGLGSWGFANLVWTFFELIYHRTPPAGSLERFLFEVPLMFFAVTAFLDSEKDSPNLSFEVFLDALQIVIVFYFLYPLVYAPSALVDQRVELKGIWILLIESVFLVMLAAIQLVRDSRPHIRALYSGFLIYIVCFSVTEYFDFANENPTGTWRDFSWTLVLIGGALWAVSWKGEPEPHVPAPVRARSIGKLIVTNATLALAPLIVLLEVTQVGPQQQMLRFFLLGISILCFAARLGLSEYRQSLQVEALRLHEIAIQSARDELFVQKVYLEQLIESAPEAIAIVDLNNVVQRINREFTRLFGWTPEEACGRDLDTLVVPPDRRAEGLALNRDIGDGSTASVETIRLSKAGIPIDVSILGAPVNLGEGRGAIYCIYRDVRERKRVESQLRQSQKMEAVGRLAGGVAHDFNNLLAVILGHNELLALEASPSARPKIEAIEAAVKRGSSLTNQLLAFSRKQMVQPVVLDLNLIVSETDKMLRRLIGEDVELTVELDPELGRLRADSSQIVQVILNLAINARDAMPNGGQIAIRTANIEFPEGTVRQGVPVRPGCYISLLIRDTGSGMTPEVRTHVFEPFFTTKPVGKGTGLGLATVYGIVKANAGYIFVESEVDRGTTFEIFLPRVDELAHTPVLQPISRAVSTSGSETILLVEDEPALSRLIHENLQRSGYQVLVASDGVEALHLAAQYKGPIQLLITDVIMPQMNGTELAQRIAGIRPHIKVLYMSGYTDAVTSFPAPNGGVALIHKPFKWGALALKLRELLSEGAASVSQPR